MASLYDFLISEASSSTTGGVNAAENQDPSTVNDGMRALKQLLAAFLDDLGGVNTVGGTGDAVTVTIASQISAYADGLMIAIKAGAANTGAATINVTGASALGAKKIRRKGDAALQANDMVANGRYLLWYDASYDSAAGAFVLMNPEGGATAASATEQLTGTSTAKSATPDSVAALWEKGSDVASAATVSLGEGGLFHITGTTTITDIDFATAKDGRTAILIFDGILTLTHNATTLKLPGAANIVTAAGDRCIVTQDSSDNVVVVMYQRADGSSVSAPQSLGTSDSPQFAGIELGHATDTTLSRGAAGFMAVEGKRVPSPASQAAGDMLYRGSSEWERLAKGTAGQILTMNAGATAPEWASAESSGQPIATSSTFAVGSLIFGKNNTGGSINAGASFAGSGFLPAAGAIAALGSGIAQNGTYVNYSGATISSAWFLYAGRTA